jgi:hypothetical protein
LGIWKDSSVAQSSDPGCLSSLIRMSCKRYVGPVHLGSLLRPKWSPP